MYVYVCIYVCVYICIPVCVYMYLCLELHAPDSYVVVNGSLWSRGAYMLLMLPCPVCVYMYLCLEFRLIDVYNRVHVIRFVGITCSLLFL